MMQIGLPLMLNLCIHASASLINPPKFWWKDISLSDSGCKFIVSCNPMSTIYRSLGDAFSMQKRSKGSLAKVMPSSHCSLSKMAVRLSSAEINMASFTRMGECVFISEMI